MEIKGTIERLLPVQQGLSKSSGQPWQSREFIIRLDEGSEQYPRRILVKAFTKAVEALGNAREGQHGTFNIDFNVREYNGRYYNDVSLYTVAIDMPSGMQQVGPTAEARVQNIAQQMQQPLPPATGNEVELPF
jgi:hypothetical protein